MRSKQKKKDTVSYTRKGKLFFAFVRSHAVPTFKAAAVEKGEVIPGWITADVTNDPNAWTVAIDAQGILFRQGKILGTAQQQDAAAQNDVQTVLNIISANDQPDPYAFYIPAGDRGH